MPVISSTIPNLITGVSQQPPAQRLETSAEDMVNCYPDVIEGLMKRPPTEFVGTMASLSGINSDAAIHTINRDLTEKYVVVSDNQSINIFDTNGVEQTVNLNGNGGYLPTTESWKKLRFVSIADTTFVLNTEKVVSLATSTETRSNPWTTASVFVERAVASTSFAIYVDNVLAATFATSDNTTAGTALEGTSDIAQALVTDAIANGYTDAQAIGPVVTFSVPEGAKLTVLDQFGGKAMEPYTGRIQSFDRLPPQEIEGRLVQIKGKVGDASEDYWVEFKDGVWTETIGYEEQAEFDVSTMPHVLVRQANGEFDLLQHTWNPREVGDYETNEVPSFVGSTINDLFLYKNRLGFLTGENLVMSAAGEYERFFRATVVQILPSDRIDVSSVTGRVDTLYHAMSFSDQLILFSDQRQFKVQSQGVLSPQTIEIVPSTTFNGSPFTRPVASGPNLFFTANGPTHSVIRELFVDEELDTVDADDVTIQVPRYIPRDVRDLSVSLFDNVLVALSENERDTLYCYKWYTQAGEKVQSAWGKWVFTDSTILGTEFLDGYLYIVVKDGSGEVHLTKMLMDPTSGDLTYLDRKFTLSTMVYDAPSDITTVTTPYAYADTLSMYVMESGNYGFNIPAFKINDTTYELDGDWTASTIDAGIEYSMSYTFSPIYIRTSSQTGNTVSIQDTRLQLRYLQLNYTDTSYFKVTVTPTSNTPSEIEFDAQLLTDTSYSLDELPKDTGEFRFPVYARNTEVDIKITNDSPFACQFGSVEWSGMYHQRTRRI